MVELVIFYFEGLSACVALTSHFLYLFLSTSCLDSSVTLSFKGKIEELIQEIISSTTAAAILYQNCEIILLSLIQVILLEPGG